MIFINFHQSKIELELIDTLWNVNQIKYAALFVQSRELIDTLWNVNEEWGRRMASELRELIDTLWNVNMLLTVKSSIRQEN